MEDPVQNSKYEGLIKKYEELKEDLKRLGSVAVAYSGGVDSSFLLKAAKDALGDRMAAITVRSEFFPDWEASEAEEYCRKEGIRQYFLDFEILSISVLRNNPADRCYICKKELFGRMLSLAQSLGLESVIDGSNLDDMGDYRPGLKAIQELGIYSPLRGNGFGKEDIRKISRLLGIPTWNKPSLACLASRFVYGEIIDKRKLTMVEKAEKLLRSLGFNQFRTRIHGENLARIEVSPEDFQKLLSSRELIIKEFLGYGFKYIAMDMKGYRTGSMNESIQDAE